MSSLMKLFVSPSPPTSRVDNLLFCIPLWNSTFHSYCNEMLLYVHFSNFEHLGDRVCLLFIATWMSDRHLKLNVSKSGHLIFFAQMTPPLKWSSSQLMAVSPFQLLWPKNLGTTPHIQSVSKSCWLSLWNTSRNQSLLITSRATTLVQTTITSHWHHLSSLLTGLAASPLSPVAYSPHGSQSDPAKRKSDHVSSQHKNSPMAPHLSQSKAKILQWPTGPIQSGLLLNLWSYLLVRSPSHSAPATWSSLLFLEQARCTSYPGPLHWLFPC